MPALVHVFFRGRFIIARAAAPCSSFGSSAWLGAAVAV